MQLSIEKLSNGQTRIALAASTGVKPTTFELSPAQVAQAIDLLKLSQSMKSISLSLKIER